MCHAMDHIYQVAFVIILVIGGATTQSSRSCTVDEFTCVSGECVELSKRCNRMADCRDASDEVDCRKYTHPFLPLVCATAHYSKIYRVFDYIDFCMTLVVFSAA